MASVDFEYPLSLLKTTRLLSKAKTIHVASESDNGLIGWTEVIDARLALVWTGIKTSFLNGKAMVTGTEFLLFTHQPQ